MNLEDIKALRRLNLVYSYYEQSRINSKSFFNITSHFVDFTAGAERVAAKDFYEIFSVCRCIDWRGRNEVTLAYSHPGILHNMKQATHLHIRLPLEEICGRGI